MADIASLSVSIGADIKDLKSKMSQVENQLKSTQQTVNKFSDNFKAVGGIIAGALSVGAIVGFGKEVIAITAEFQKFQAVLTNTLGSESKAQIALQRIQDFAAQTPFAVQELTDSFVRLANQGFEPTSNEMRKLGDLASSTGKSFTQLTEAIIDAQTGEFERLKEFGIRASKQGDQVKFTFKGVETQTKFTADAIREYVLSLGDANGVSGAMASISKTLGGQISNLGDSWGQLLVTIGNGTSGVMSDAIAAMNDVINATTRLLKTTEQLNKEAHLKNIGQKVEELSGRYNQLVEDAKKYQNLDEVGAKQAAYTQLAEELQKVIRLREEELQQMVTNTDAEVGLSREALDNIAKEYKIRQQNLEVAKAQFEALQKFNPNAVQAQEKVLGLLEAERKKLKEVQAAREAATSEGAIRGYNLQIEAINRTIERLEKLGQTYGLIGQIQDKIRQAEEKRTKAGSIEEIGRQNDIIDGLKEQAALYDEVSIKAYELSKIEIKPIEPKPVNIQINTTDASIVLDNLNKQMALVSAEAEVFGSSFDSAAAKVSLLQQAISALLEQGIAPSHPIIQGLNDQIKSLSNTFQQIAIDVTGMAADAFSSLADSFGQLATGAKNVDDFGKSILASVSNFVGQLGKAMIATGTASLALKQVVSNPYAAIAAGAVLVALSSATKSMMQRGPASPSMSAGPIGSGNQNVNGYVQQNSQHIELSATVRGSDILLSNKKQTYRDNLRT